MGDCGRLWVTVGDCGRLWVTVINMAAARAGPPLEEAAVEPIAVTVKQACEALSLGTTKVYELIGKGDLETVKIGRATRVKVASIKRLAEAE